MLLVYGFLEQVVVEKLRAEDIKLENSKMLDIIFDYIFDCYTAEVTVFDFFFLNIDKHNSRNCCKCNIYYFWILFSI